MFPSRTSGCVLLVALSFAFAAPLASSGASEHYLESLLASSGGFGPNVRISDPSVSARKLLPNVAVDGKGGIFAAYIEDAGTGKDIYLAVSKDWGKTWTRMGRANDVQGKVWGAQQAQPGIAVDPSNGHVYVVWTDLRAGSTSYDVYSATSMDGGSTFGAGVKVDKTTTGAQLVIRVGVDASGNIHALWANEEVLPARLGYARSTNMGQSFETPKWIDQVGSESCECCAPSILFGPASEVRVIYRTGTTQKMRNINVIKSTDGGGNWGAPTKVSDWDWTASACPATGPSSTRDSKGNLHVLAADIRSGDRDVYHYKSTDGGATWGASKKLNTPTTGSQDQPSVISVGDDIVAMWEDRGTDTSGEAIYRTSSDQGATWGAEAKLNSDSTNGQEMPLGAASGDAGFAVWADSRSGGSEVFGCAYFGADSQPPTISLTAPANGSTVGGLVDVTADANDNIVVMKVEFFLDATKQGEAVVSPYKWSWDTQNSTDGTHTIKAVAYDGAGNKAEAYATITVKNQGSDTTPPTVALTTPANGATVQGSVTVAATATDNKAVADVEFFIDAASIGKATATPYQVQWDTTQSASGAHTVLARATDTSGNQADSSVSVTVDQTAQDNTKPVVTITAPVDGATVGGVVKVKADVTDNVGVTNSTLKVDGVSKGSVTAAPWQWDLDTTKLSDGPHTVRVEGADAAGNVGYSEISVKSNNSAIDRPPSISIDSHKIGDHVKGKVTIVATATDDRKVASVTFFVDGVSQYKDTGEPWSWEWDSTKVTDGEHRITAKATDSAGKETSAIVSLVVENGPGGTPISNGVLGLGQFADYAVAGIAILLIAGVVFALTRGKRDRQAEYNAYLRQQGWR
ncbi:MAG TPA: Ig-like domain-containing protein [Thermoplasmata archaeon]|nr:Ig-like domain-containing protein [Thermoplasmata archaeon]